MTSILIVDDDQEMCESLRDVLDARGYLAQACDSSVKALDLVRDQAFDVILLDIKMPIMNGVETFKKLKQIRPGQIVIMMTAYSLDELIKEALAEGAFGCLRKPLDINKVVEQIEAAKKGALIMVVDDDPLTRLTLKDILEAKGYLVSTAANGPEAIEKCTERPPQIIFIDLKMPVLNGLETYLQLQAITPQIIAVMMTGFREEMQDLVQQALSSHAYACLYKPLNPAEVLRLINEILKTRSTG